jgi:hypothetical protein
MRFACRSARRNAAQHGAQPCGAGLDSGHAMARWYWLLDKHFGIGYFARRQTH